MTEPTDNYLRTFNWNKVRYRADKPIAELIDILQKVSWLAPSPRVLPRSLGRLANMLASPGTCHHRQ